jgi:hypothetical protein
MSAIPPMSGDKQASGEQAINDANDPLQTSSFDQILAFGWVYD